ncbi:phage tail sheath C-terminal domain-containing protein [Pseudomonas aeruginosa]|uniref:phage tail sheath family protein n=1 Tax=Pseudomonas aeruginosa TaxID=287 RepID=UPI002ADDE3F2|nr:phage tail sheath C-terminal domain-containing protein [Pseudomonas aeruginosa]MEA0988991.1 phage tail sheath C-terminal domain-containing protein [Pseudomonas aeruginosa]
MSNEYAVPGVYVSETGGRSLAVVSGETAVPVLVGRYYDKTGALCALTGCERVESWADFSRRYMTGPFAVYVAGKPQESRVSPEQLSAESVRLYFENGGGPCYVLSLPKPSNKLMSKSKKSKSSKEVVVGDEWSAALAALPERVRAFPEISLLVWCEVDDHARDQEVYSALENLLSSGADNGGYFLLLDGWHDGGAIQVPQTSVANQTAAYYPGLDVESVSVPSISLTALDKAYWGQQALSFEAFIQVCKYKWLDESKPAREALIKQLEKIFSKPPLASMSVQEREPDGASLLQELEKLLKDGLDPIVVPPVRASVLMAGVYARVDRERGVWKAPANVDLAGVVGLSELRTGTAVYMTDVLNESLVGAKVNALRPFRGRGTMVWGARTMVDPQQTDWRYVSVRRLCNAVERDLRDMLRSVVFEPNNAVTWERIRGAADHYLHHLWQRGALQGETAAQGYFVAIGLGETMQQEDLDQGRLLLKIGVAAVRPAEFIVLELTQDVKSG